MESQAMLTPIITTAFGVILALVIELIPGFASWWDGMEKDMKRSARGLIGLIIVALASLGHYMGWYDIGLNPVFAVPDALVIIFSWISFVTGSEMTYQSTRSSLPRKNDIARYMAKA